MKEFERTTEFRGRGNRKEQINKEQTEMLTLLNYKKQDKIYIRYAI